MFGVLVEKNVHICVYVNQVQTPTTSNPKHVKHLYVSHVQDIFSRHPYQRKWYIIAWETVILLRKTSFVTVYLIWLEGQGVVHKGILVFNTCYRM